MASGARVVAKACLASTPRWIRILGRDLLAEVQNLEASKSAGHVKNIGDPPELACLVVGHTNCSRSKWRCIFVWERGL